MGCDVLHGFDLPEGNRSSGLTISSVADRDARVVLSKDNDFSQSHLLRGGPARLLIVATGNIGNQEHRFRLERCQSGQMLAFEGCEKFRQQVSAGEGKALFAEVECSSLTCPVVDLAQPVAVPAEQV